MKTSRLKKIGMLLAALFLVSACGSSDDSGSTASTSTYSWGSNGTCYSNTGTVVDPSNCANSAAAYPNGYYPNNQGCYANGGMVPGACSGTGVMPGGMGMGYGSMRSCYGSYLWATSYGTSMVGCYGYNCHGYTLFEYATQSWVTCM